MGRVRRAASPRTRWWTSTCTTRCEGKADIAHWFKEELSQTHAGKEGDVCIHPIITVDGDTAKGNWLLYMMYFYPRTGQSMFWVQGHYDKDYVRENGALEDRRHALERDHRPAGRRPADRALVSRRAGRADRARFRGIPLTAAGAPATMRRASALSKQPSGADRDEPWRRRGSGTDSGGAQHA